MSFLSGLKAFGNDIEKVFAWTNSTQGKAVVSIVEGAVESFVPQTIPLVNLINSWGQKAFAVEALAVAAGQSSGNGAQKAAMVISSITPEVLQYA